VKKKNNNIVEFAEIVSFDVQSTQIFFKCQN
jgi:hypothetical protein